MQMKKTMSSKGFVRIRGLPYNCNKEQVQQFFRGLFFVFPRALASQIQSGVVVAGTGGSFFLQLLFIWIEPSGFCFFLTNKSRVDRGGGGVREGTWARGATYGRGVCQIRHCRRGRSGFATKQPTHGEQVWYHPCRRKT